MSSELDTNAKRSILADHLRQKAQAGNIYFKSGNIAEELGLTPKEVGANLVFLADEIDDLVIEKWSRASSVTWRVEEIQ